MNIVLQKPIITEKSMNLAKNGFYTFMVDKQATKADVARVVEEVFSVKVEGVSVVNVKGKLKAQRRVRKTFRVPGFKKAIVQLQKGQKIALFETPVKEAVVTTAEGEPIILREKKDLLGKTKVKVERGATGAAPTTQRKVITGK
ncbi:50S ribosomal protein L23 [Candidatus Daviesbacteria bacterium]|nr:50S ribosomal protein L23 [Candidatus Daviesbacteria bacterium]